VNESRRVVAIADQNLTAGLVGRLPWELV